MKSQGWNREKAFLQASDDWRNKSPAIGSHVGKQHSFGFAVKMPVVDAKMPMIDMLTDAGMSDFELLCESVIGNHSYIGFKDVQHLELREES